MKLVKAICIAIFFAFSINGHAQSISSQVLSNAGNTIVSPQMRLSWTLGEVAVARWEAPNNTGSLTEGFHQPNIQLGKNSFSDFSLVQIIPNPVQDILNLNVVADSETRYLASLQDPQGKTLVKDLVLKDKTELDMSSYPAGVYFLSIWQSGSSNIQTHKIIKL